MPAKIRLSRHGRKRAAFYHIIVADSRAPRDGRYIERIGSYNPNTNPATIDLNFDSALEWLQKGAQPTDTARAILSYKGVTYMNHLLKGVAKGALTEEQAKAKFEAWSKDKEAKIQAKIDKLSDEKSSDKKNRLDAESKINEERAQAIAKKKSDLAAEEEAANKVEETVDETTEEVAEEKEEVTEVKEEVVEAKKETTTEVKEEVSEVKKEETTAEVKKETKEVKKEAKDSEETKK
ncbi:MAG: 30S ribosomal protein S16 [Bacteroidota bacterium]